MIASAASAAAASTDAAPGFVVWGAGGPWVGDEGTEPMRLPLAAEATLPPVPIADGLWALQGRRLLRWQRDHQRAWRVLASHAFDADVHALAASPDGHHLLAAHHEGLSHSNRHKAQVW